MLTLAISYKKSYNNCLSVKEGMSASSRGKKTINSNFVKILKWNILGNGNLLYSKFAKN